MGLTRRGVLALLGISLCAPAAALAGDADIRNEADARRHAIELGVDPDEVVSYGPPFFSGDRDPEDREAPIWMLLDPQTRSRLP